jgi:hypothetical protein
MTEQHPITPPPELVRKWIDEATSQTYAERWIFIVEQAARWGYEQRGEVNDAQLRQARDQELEACCEWLRANGLFDTRIQHLRAARRPKPPSLKEQALKAAHIELDPEGKNGSLIIRALEALPDD